MTVIHLLNTAIIPAFPGSFRVYGGSYDAAYRSDVAAIDASHIARAAV